MDTQLVVCCTEACIDESTCYLDTKRARPLVIGMALLVLAAVPGEVGGVGAESGLGREGERAVVEVGEFEVRAAGEDRFGDVGLRDLDAEVVIDGPEAGVEEIMGRRGQG